MAHSVEPGEGRHAVFMETVFKRDVVLYQCLPMAYITLIKPRQKMQQLLSVGFFFAMRYAPCALPANAW